MEIFICHHINLCGGVSGAWTAREHAAGSHRFLVWMYKLTKQHCIALGEWHPSPSYSVSSVSPSLHITLGITQLLLHGENTKYLFQTPGHWLFRSFSTFSYIFCFPGWRADCFLSIFSCCPFWLFPCCCLYFFAVLGLELLFLYTLLLKRIIAWMEGRL